MLKVGGQKMLNHDIISELGTILGSSIEPSSGKKPFANNVVLAAKDDPLNVIIQKEVAQGFLDLNDRKQKSEMSQKLGGRLNIRMYKKASFVIDNLAMTADGGAQCTMRSSTKVSCLFFKGTPFETASLEYTERVTINLEGGNDLKGAKGTGGLTVIVVLTLDPTDVTYLCGGSKTIEHFKLAAALGIFAETAFQNLPPYRDPKSIKTRKKGQKTGFVVRLNTGILIYLHGADSRGKIENELRESFDPLTNTFDTSLQTIKQDIVYWNLDAGELAFVSSSGQLMALAIDGAMELTTPSTILSMLGSKFDSVVYKSAGKNPKDYLISAIENGAMSIISGSALQTLQDTLWGRNYNGEVLLEEMVANCGEEETKAILDATAKYLRSKEATETIKHPIRRYSLLGIVVLMRNCVGKVADYKKVLADRIEKMQNATGDDLQELPENLKKTIEFFPHQADAIAKLQYTNETAILHVATGGGKTLLLMADIAYQMGEGNVFRPLLMMPPSLIPQWFDEIHSFSASKFNAMVITTETVGKWGEEEITKMIKASPKNTIFLSTYKWIILGKEERMVGQKKVVTFPNVEYLRQFNFDYVGLDESHNIKNPSSAAHKACVQLSNSATYKRIATGTLTPNTAMDIVGQMTFIDPTIFGTQKDFSADYAAVTKGGKILALQEGAEERIQERLRDAGAVTKTRKDWFYVLPKIKDNFHKVTMTDTQQKLYNMMVTNAIDEITKDPKTKDQWEEMVSDPDAESVPIELLAKLMMIEAFSSDPASSPYGRQNILQGDDLKSPKMPKILELLDIHFSKTPNEKVLIFTQHQEKVIEYVYKNLGKYKDMARLYRGGMKAALDDFKNDPSIKILVACDKSLKEGHNLQMASRMIRLDVHWSPGDLDQVIARIYRIDKREGAEPRDTIFIDWILCDKTIDVLKFRRTIRKLVVNSRAVGIIDPDEIEDKLLFPVNVDNLMMEAKFDDAANDEILDYVKFRGLEESKWHELRKTMSIDPVPIKTKEAIPGEEISTPIPEGARIPGDEDKINVSDAVDEYVDGDYKKLISYRAKTEFGMGTISKIYINSKEQYVVDLIYDDEKNRPSISGSIVEVFNEIDPNFGDKQIDIDKPGMQITIANRNFWITPEGVIHKVSAKGKLGKMFLLYAGKKGFVTTKGKPYPKMTPQIEYNLKLKLQKLGMKFGPGELVDPNAKSVTYKEFTMKGKDFIMSSDGSIGKKLRNGKMGKAEITFKDGVWVVKKTGKPWDLTASTLNRYTKYLKDLGYPGLQDGAEPTAPEQPKTPKQPMTPKQPKVINWKEFSIKGNKYALNSKGEICKVGASGKYGKALYTYNAKTKDWLSRKGESGNFSKAVSDKYLKWLKALGWKEGKVLKTPESEKKPPKTPKPTPGTKPGTGGPGKSGDDDSKPDKDIEAVNPDGLEGFGFEDSKKRKRILLPNGAIHTTNKQQTIAKRKVYFFKDGQWFSEKTGNPAKMDDRTIKKLIGELNKLNAKKVTKKEKKVKKVPKTTPEDVKTPEGKTPKGKVPKKVKKVKKSDLDQAPTAITLQALNINGLPGIMIDCDEENLKNVKIATRQLKFKYFPFFRITLNPAKVKKVQEAIRSKKLKPANKGSLLKMLDKWKLATRNIKQMDDAETEELRVLMKKGAKQSTKFLVYPVVVGSKLELWINAAKPDTYRKHQLVMKELKFKRQETFLRTFAKKALMPQVVSPLIGALKHANIPIENLKVFKVQVDTIKKHSKK